MLLSRVLEKCNEPCLARYGHPIDFSRAWWTPPLSAKQALDLEASQIEDQLGLGALVSITDHDSIEAARMLSMTSAGKDTIWSVEWSVPYRGSCLHVGVHNMPVNTGESVMTAMRQYTRNPDERQIPEILDWIASSRDSLIVLNHPFWDEKSIGLDVRLRSAKSFLTHFRGLVHAVELNGLRPWSENMQVMDLANDFQMIAVSGGDRHGTEPNAVLNLTNASTFAEFAQEVRFQKRSDILFMPQYRHSTTARLMHYIGEIVGDYPAHSLGQAKWSDRIFYRCNDGSIKSLAQLWSGHAPAIADTLVGFTQLARRSAVRSALRFAFRAGEVY